MQLIDSIDWLSDWLIQLIYFSGAGLVHFLNKDWFSAAAGILAGVNSELSEKLIILLQRLSTTRSWP